MLKVKIFRGKGRGVISSVSYKAGDEVEACPVLPLTPVEYDKVLGTSLQDYIYTWPGPRQKPSVDQSKWTGACVCLGYGSLYNHSSNPNLNWKASIKGKVIKFFAVRDIKAGEELTHSYEWPEWMYKQTGVPNED